MEPASIVSGVSFRQNPRPGQREVWERNELKTGNQLNIKLPTGYGKTLTATGVYSILKARSRAQRILYVVPSDAQLTQFILDGPRNLALANVDGPLAVTDLRFIAPQTVLTRHRRNECQVFTITVQALLQPSGKLICSQLFETGQWLIVIDEYHHYGVAKSWGKAINGLPRAFLLAMSATPYRPDADSAFGAPDVVVTYRAAVEQNAVKPLRGHSYEYRIDAINETGEVVSYTTQELADAAGGDDPERIERLRIKRKMRWSPKYVSPLVRIPIERMLVERVRTGQRLQALVSAMCVSHAELVCTQLRSMFPELAIEWVGTGEYGRSNEENADILRKFCPPKDETGERPSSLDVLVHVGMAGEGLDVVDVSEIILLRTARANNRDLQTIGRASRYRADIIGNINFDSSTELASNNYVGAAIMDAMDLAPAQADDEPSEPREPNDDVPELPDQPNILIANLELVRIDSGDAGVQRMARVLESANVTGIDYNRLQNLDDPEWQKIIDIYRNFRRKEASELDERSSIAQWRNAVDNAVSVVAGLVIKTMMRSGTRIDRSLIGDIKKRINFRKKEACGEIANDIALCRNHWNWIKQLERNIRSNGLPLWLL